MLYESLKHPHLLLIYLTIGFGCGFIFDIGNFIKFLFCNKKIPCFIIDFIKSSTALLVCFFINLYYNYGEIRFIYIILITTSFIIERLIIGKIVAKFYFKCYNTLERLRKKLWSKSKDDKTNKTN